MTPAPFTLALDVNAFLRPTHDGRLVWGDRRGNLFAIHRRGGEILAVEVDFGDAREVFTLRLPSGEFHLRDCAPLQGATRLDAGPA